MLCVDCTDYLSKSLFLVGEIGGNDYNYAFLQGLSMAQIQAFVPRVVEAIAGATSVRIDQTKAHKHELFGK